jgi:dihydroxyacetone kinase-like protein
MYLLNAYLLTAESGKEYTFCTKTMMDALIPASDAIAASNGDVDEILDMASLAALNGAEFSKLVPAKFGSARAFGEKTIGTPDVGAMSISFFFMGLSRK